MPAKVLTLHTMTFQFPIGDTPEEAAESAIKGFVKACELRKLQVINRPYAMAQLNLLDPAIMDIIVRGAVQPKKKEPTNEKANKKVENL